MGYYRTLGQELGDKLACPIKLEYDQCLKGKIKWSWWCVTWTLSLLVLKAFFFWHNKGEGRKLACWILILLKIMEDLDHSQRHNIFMSTWLTIATISPTSLFYGLWLYNKTPARNNLITELAARSKLQRKVRWQQSQSAGVLLWMRCNHDGGWSF
jgi:hypothetical protein